MSRGADAVGTMSKDELKHWFIERAKALSKEPEIFRSVLMTSLIAESVGFGIPADAEYFEAAYGDRAGRGYWDAYLSEPMRVGAFAYLLSVHMPVSSDRLEAARVAITLALRDAAAAGERLFIGDIGPLLAPAKYDFDALIGIKVKTLLAVKWLLSKPRREYLVAASLRSFLELSRDHSTAPTKPRLFSRSYADKFAAEYINEEKAAGRSPTLVGLEDAAKKAGFHGGREYLRDAFHRSPDVVVKEGRPSKLAQ